MIFQSGGSDPHHSPRRNRTDGMRTPHRPETCEPAGIIINDDITKKSRRESGSFVSEPQPENTGRAGRACDDDYPDRITHHNERSTKDQPDEQPETATTHAPAPEEEPAQLTTYDPAGEIPFSNWDGEEGPRP